MKFNKQQQAELDAAILQENDRLMTAHVDEVKWAIDRVLIVCETNFFQNPKRYNAAYDYVLEYILKEMQKGKLQAVAEKEVAS